MAEKLTVDRHCTHAQNHINGQADVKQVWTAVSSIFKFVSIYDDDYYFARPFFVSQQLLSWDPTQGLR